MSASPLKIIALSLLVVTAVLCVVSQATNEWFDLSFGTLASTGGLWRACSKIGTLEACSRWEDADSIPGKTSLYGARAGCLLAILLILPVGALIASSMMDGRGRLALVAGGILVLATIFQAGGAGAGAKWIKVDLSNSIVTYDFGYSFFIAAGCTGLFGAITILSFIAGAASRSNEVSYVIQ